MTVYASAGSDADGLMLVDTPGYGDNRLPQDAIAANLSNALMYKKIKTIAALLVVVPETSVYDKKGDNFRELVEALFETYQDCSWVSHMQFIFTKMTKKTVAQLKMKIHSLLNDLAKSRPQMEEFCEHLLKAECRAFNATSVDRLFIQPMRFPTKDCKSHLDDGSLGFLRKMLKSTFFDLKSSYERSSALQTQVKAVREDKHRMEVTVRTFLEKKGSLEHGFAEIGEQLELLRDAVQSLERRIWSANAEQLAASKVVDMTKERLKEENKSTEVIVWRSRQREEVTISSTSHKFFYSGEEFTTVRKVDHNQNSYVFSSPLKWTNETRTETSFTVLATTGHGVNMDAEVILVIPYNQQTDVKRRVAVLNKTLQDNTNKMGVARQTSQLLRQSLEEKSAQMVVLNAKFKNRTLDISEVSAQITSITAENEKVLADLCAQEQALLHQLKMIQTSEQTMRAHHQRVLDTVLMFVPLEEVQELTFQ
jgi:hypothetical protein